MSLFTGYDNITTGGLPTTGGTMTGNINMGSNHIITFSKEEICRQQSKRKR